MDKEEAMSAILKAEEIQVKEDLALQKIKSGARFNQICNIDEHVDNLQSGISTTLRLTL